MIDVGSNTGLTCAILSSMTPAVVSQCSGPKRVARLVRKATGVCMICCLNMRSSAATKSPRASCTDLPIGVGGCSLRLLGLSAALHSSAFLLVWLLSVCNLHAVNVHTWQLQAEQLLNMGALYVCMCSMQWWINCSTRYPRETSSAYSGHTMQCLGKDLENAKKIELVS